MDTATPLDPNLHKPTPPPAPPEPKAPPAKAKTTKPSTHKYLAPLAFGIGALVVAYLLFGVVRPMVSGRRAANTMTTTPSPGMVRNPVEDAKKMLFTGTSFVCTYGTGDFAQTLSVKDKMAAIRGPVERIIYKDDTVYVWNDKNASATAMMIKVGNDATKNPMAWQFMARLQALRRDLTKCKDGPVETAVFDIPKGIQFKTIEDMQKMMKANMDEQLKKMQEEQKKNATTTTAPAARVTTAPAVKVITVAPTVKATTPTSVPTKAVTKSPTQE